DGVADREGLSGAVAEHRVVAGVRAVGEAQVVVVPEDFVTEDRVGAAVVDVADGTAGRDVGGEVTSTAGVGHGGQVLAVPGAEASGQAAEGQQELFQVQAHAPLELRGGVVDHSSVVAAVVGAAVVHRGLQARTQEDV